MFALQQLIHFHAPCCQALSALLDAPADTLYFVIEVTLRLQDPQPEVSASPSLPSSKNSAHSVFGAIVLFIYSKVNFGD